MICRPNYRSAQVYAQTGKQCMVSDSIIDQHCFHVSGNFKQGSTIGMLKMPLKGFGCKFPKYTLYVTDHTKGFDLFLFPS